MGTITFLRITPGIQVNVVAMNAAISVCEKAGHWPLGIGTPRKFKVHGNVTPWNVSKSIEAIFLKPYPLPILTVQWKSIVGVTLR